MTKTGIFIFLIIGLLNFAQAQKIINAEYFVDTDPGRGSRTAIAIGAIADSLDLNFKIPTAGLPIGSHQLYFCFEDSLHNWSISDGKSFIISDNDNSKTAKIIRAEYFIDTDPGRGNGTPIAIGTAADSLDLNFKIPTAGLPIGSHQLYFCFEDSLHYWSISDGKSFIISDTTNAQLLQIISGEYFFDTDPGVGNGNTLNGFVSSDSVEINQKFHISSLSEGMHQLFFRFTDSQGNTSISAGKYFQIKSTQNTATTYITEGEFFFDNDPGVGNASPINIVGAADSLDLNFYIGTDNLTTGTHILCMRFKDSLGNWGFYQSDTINKITCFFPRANFSVADVCEGNPITYTNLSTAVNSNTSYHWDIFNNGNTIDTSKVSWNYNGMIAAGTYSTKLIISNGQGCTDTIIKSFTIDALPAPYLGNDTAICAGDSIIFSPGSFISYQWNNNSTDTIIKTSSAATYWVEVSDINGCTKRDSIILSINNLPTVSVLGIANSYCINSGVATLTTTPTGGILSGSGITGNSFYPSVSGIGNHQIIYQYTDTQSCSNSDTIFTTVYAQPMVNITSSINSTYCATGDSVLLSANPNGGVFSGVNIQNSGYLILDTSNIGTKSIIYEFTDSHSCTNSDTIFTWIHALPKVYFTGLSSSYCPNNATDILVPNIIGGIFSGSGINGSSFNPSQANIGQNDIKYSFTNNYGCTDSIIETTHIYPNPPVSVFTGSPTIFTAPPFVVNFNSNIINAANYTLNWYFGDGASSQDSMPVHLYSNNGNYTVSLSAYDQTTGCTDTMTKSGYIGCSGANPCGIIAQIYPTTINHKDICPGDSFLLNAGTYNSSYTYQWLRNGMLIPDATGINYYASQFGYYQIMINNTDCSSFSNIFVINIYNSTPPVISKLGNLQPCINDSMKLFTSTNYANYLWSNDDTNSFTYIKASGYYTLSTIDIHGCKLLSLPIIVNASYLDIPQICKVEVDSASGKNIIIWNNNNIIGTDSFKIYRESSITNHYDLVASLASSSNNFIIDGASKPKTRYYTYRIIAVDTCGFATPHSSFHRNIHLYATAGMNNSWNLFWNKYRGKNSITYRIYRGVDTLNMQLLAQLPANILSYTDLNPPTGDVNYLIKAVFTESCSSNSNYNSKTSASNFINSKDASGIGILEIKGMKYSAIIYPNPNNGIFRIKYLSNSKTATHIAIYNSIGVQVYVKQMEASQSNSEIKIELPNMARGMYFVRLQQNNRIYIAKMIVF